MLLNVLLTIYVCLMTIDLMFMVTLHLLHDRQGYYKTAAGVWFGMLSAFLVDGLVASEIGPVHHLFGVSLHIITSYHLLKLAARIYKFDFPKTRFLQLAGGTWTTGLVMHYGLGMSFTPTAGVICLGAVAPALYGGYRILRSWRTLTIIDRLFGMLLIGEAIHILDYPFLRNTEDAALFGFSLALLMAYFASMLVPVVINRRLAADFNEILQSEIDAKTRHLETSLRDLSVAQAKLVNSSKLAALGEMAGGIAHEINTPLCVIMGRAEQLSQILADAETVELQSASRISKTIEGTAQRIAKVVQGLRAFSRSSDADPMADHDLSIVVRDTLDLCAERIRSRGIEMRIDRTPEVTLSCRPEQISQVLINILNNASDAVRALPTRWVAITFVESASAIEIRVLDSGAGIAAELEMKIFHPFFTTKPVGEGTGLGLSISKGIVEDHGGSLYVDQTADNTCFVIQLPTKVTGRRATAGDF